MKKEFGTNVIYVDPYEFTSHHAVILQKHDKPSEGDFIIAIKTKKGKFEQKCVFSDRLSFMEDSILDLLEAERQRAMDIAYKAMENHKSIQAMQESAGNRMAFVEGELANECRIIGNAISGGNALSDSIGETMRDRIRENLLEKGKKNAVPNK